MSGIFVTVIFYSIFSFFISKNIMWISAWITPIGPIHSVVNTYFQAVSFSYLAFGPVLFYLVFKEQTGQGKVAFKINAIYFSSILLAGRFFLDHYHCLSIFFQVIAVTNFFIFLIIIFLKGEYHHVG